MQIRYHLNQCDATKFVRKGFLIPTKRFLKYFFMIFSFNPLRVTSGNNISQAESIIKKIFDREMLIKTLPTTLLQILLQVVLYYKVIVKSTIVPDDNFYRNS